MNLTAPYDKMILLCKTIVQNCFSGPFAESKSFCMTKTRNVTLQPPLHLQPTAIKCPTNAGVNAAITILLLQYCYYNTAITMLSLLQYCYYNTAITILSLLQSNAQCSSSTSSRKIFGKLSTISFLQAD